MKFLFRMKASPFCLKLKKINNSTVVTAKVFENGNTHDLNLGRLSQQEIKSLIFDGEAEFLIGSIRSRFKGNIINLRLCCKKSTKGCKIGEKKALHRRSVILLISTFITNIVDLNKISNIVYLNKYFR